MARKYGVAIDLLKSELRQAAIQNLTSAPSSPATGQVYFDTVLSQFGVYTGSTWVYLYNDEALQDLVGAMVSSNTETGITVTYDDTGGKLNFVLSNLNDLPGPINNLSLGAFKITNLADGTAATDAATYGQVLSAMRGMDWKDSVRAATTVAGTLASSFESGDLIDGVMLQTADRILIKNQASGAENGIYTVNASGAPTRATDADSSAEVTGGLTVFVNEGTTQANSVWTLTTNDTIALGSTALVFAQTSASTYTAGAGITLTGLAFSATVDGVTIDTNGAGSSLQVIAGVYTKKYSATIGDGSTLAYTVTHSLNTRDVHVTVYDAATYDEITTSVNHATVNTCTITFDVAPTTNQYRVVVVG